MGPPQSRGGPVSLHVPHLSEREAFTVCAAAQGPGTPRTRRDWPHAEWSLKTSRGRSPSLEPLRSLGVAGSARAYLVGGVRPGLVGATFPSVAPRLNPRASPPSPFPEQRGGWSSKFREPRAGVAPSLFSRYF